MKNKALLSLMLGTTLICGCASNVVPMGKNTYMIEHGGWPHMNEYSLQAHCLKDANRFCDKHGLDLIQTSFTGRDGQVFAHNATCKLIFKAVPKGSPEDVPQNMVTNTDSLR